VYQSPLVTWNSNLCGDFFKNPQGCAQNGQKYIESKNGHNHEKNSFLRCTTFLCCLRWSLLAYRKCTLPLVRAVQSNKTRCRRVNIQNSLVSLIDFQIQMFFEPGVSKLSMISGLNKRRCQNIVHNLPEHNYISTIIFFLLNFLFWELIDQCSCGKNRVLCLPIYV